MWATARLPRESLFLATLLAVRGVLGHLWLRDICALDVGDEILTISKAIPMRVPPLTHRTTLQDGPLGKVLPGEDLGVVFAIFDHPLCDRCIVLQSSGGIFVAPTSCFALLRLWTWYRRDGILLLVEGSKCAWEFLDEAIE